LLTDYGLDLDREFLVDAADELAALRLGKALLEVAETKPSKFESTVSPACERRTILAGAHGARSGDGD